MGAPKWTDEAIRAEAAKYKTRGEWKKSSLQSYRAALGRNDGFLDSCASHMKRLISVAYTNESAKKALANYSSISQLLKENHSLYNYLRKNDLTSELSRLDRFGVTFDKFVERAKTLHGDAYQYHEETYLLVLKKTKITCRKHGDFWQLPSNHMKRSGCPACANESIYSIADIYKAGKKCKTRTEFRKRFPQQSALADKKFILNEVMAHAPKRIARERKTKDDTLIGEALKYKTQSELRKANEKVWTAIIKRGIQAAGFGHMVNGNLVRAPLKWTDEAMLTESKKYGTITDWQRGSVGSYQSAYKRSEEFFEQCIAHMKRGKMDNDAVYIWKAGGASYLGESVYKIGVTSARLGMNRIRTVEKESEFTATIIAMVKVNGRATAVEKKLLALGQDPKYIEFNGSSEFRAMSDAQLQQALDILNQHAVEELAIAA